MNVPKKGKLDPNKIYAERDLRKAYEAYEKQVNELPDECFKECEPQPHDLGDSVLGRYVEDGITGYQGTIISRTTWHGGLVRVMIQAKVDKDNKIPEFCMTDIDNVKFID